jgi:hypothetical protein
MKTKSGIFGCLMSLGLLTAQAATTFYSGKITVDSSNTFPYGGGANSFAATNYNQTADGNQFANMLPWLTAWNDGGGTTFSLSAGATFTFSGHYDVGDNGAPSFGIYLVDADSIVNAGERNVTANAIGFLMNNANGVRLTNPAGTGTLNLAAGGNNGGWNQQTSLGYPGLTNDFTITYTAADTANGTLATLIYTVGGQSYTFTNAPDWDNLAITFRIYNASSVLTLTDFAYTIRQIPEPSTLSLVSLSGGGGILLLLLRKYKKQALSC